MFDAVSASSAFSSPPLALSIVGFFELGHDLRKLLEVIGETYPAAKSTRGQLMLALPAFAI